MTRRDPPFMPFWIALTAAVALATAAFRSLLNL